MDDALIDADVEKASTRAAVDSSDATNCNFMVRLKIGCVEEKICGHRQCPHDLASGSITILQAHTYLCMYRVVGDQARRAAAVEDRDTSATKQTNATKFKQ